ncbi:DNA topology modulation protein [Priestia koreensis]|uniref:DNA topology modulation protein n=1 Tax=Priestia koreensis TaxID=284581 RepID=UPI00203E29C0|nr:DNA topology modulation protein [Priestia koreensis]MCM3005850.1 DNA topology modulation protein [Priestia koreensis]
MNRIVVIGSGGSGKSTFSRELGKLINIPVFHLDSLYWGPNWEKTPDNEWVETQKRYIRKEKWILDGNFSSTLEMRMKVADTIIFLDLSKYICVFRAFKRSIKYYGKTRSDMGNECYEKFDMNFLKWIWEFPQNGRLKILNHLNTLNSKEKTVILLKSPKEVRKFLSSLEL